MKARLTTICMSLLLCLTALAQGKGWNKLSPLLRRAAVSSLHATETRSTAVQAGRKVTALVRCSDARVLDEEGCQLLRNWGDIHAVSIPMDRLTHLAARPEVGRIEAGAPCQVCVDTTATLLGVSQVWQGRQDVRPLTGRGVVVGVQDIGFDLTHPNFYSRDLSTYRIKAFWDMLDPDTVDSPLPVGRDYRDRKSILQKAHATDGLKQTHGVHTAGIAAGSGYDSPYVGMAPEADLCLVSNAVGSDAEFISEEDRYKYTTATDVLGFQYILDYAESVGKPCVISFSEGAHEDLYGDAQLLYEVMERMTGPGRIIVASAGNSSVNKTYLHKPLGTDSISSFLYSNSEAAYYTLRHSDKMDLRLHFSTREHPEQDVHECTVNTDYICSLEDSLLIDTLEVEGERFMLLMASYPSCYNPDEWATELYLQTLSEGTLGMGSNHRVRLTLMDDRLDAECFASGGLFMDISSLPQYANAVPTHNINFPAAAPCVIAVGGTAYRTGAWNHDGRWKDYDMGDDGRRWIYSSVGPTMQGLTKPDVMAPACNIISSYSSFYMEQNPRASDVDWNVRNFTFNGRTYGWNCNSGTSMSCPIAAGIIALWLQLCPQLTPSDIMEVIQATSRRYDPLLTYPSNEYGWGEIDALAGATYIQQHFDCRDSITDLAEAGPLEPGGTCYDLSGRKIPEGHDAPGLYIIYNKGGYRKIMKR